MDPGTDWLFATTASTVAGRPPRRDDTARTLRDGLTFASMWEGGAEMRRALTIAGVLVCTAMLTGCAADTTPTDHAGAEPTEAMQRTFQVQLRGDMPNEAVIPAILAAGHEQLTTACEQMPETTVRILNPLASGEYADIACSTILGGEDAAQASEALSSTEHIGQVQQKGIISTVACFAGGAAAFFVPRYGICPHGSTEQARTDCNDVGGWGSFGIGFVCALTAIFPF